MAKNIFKMIFQISNTYTSNVKYIIENYQILTKDFIHAYECYAFHMLTIYMYRYSYIAKLKVLFKSIDMFLDNVQFIDFPMEVFMSYKIFLNRILMSSMIKY